MVRKTQEGNGVMITATNLLIAQLTGELPVGCVPRTIFGRLPMTLKEFLLAFNVAAAAALLTWACWPCKWGVALGGAVLLLLGC